MKKKSAANSYLSRKRKAFKVLTRVQISIVNNNRSGIIIRSLVAAIAIKVVRLNQRTKFKLMKTMEGSLREARDYLY